MSKRLVWALLVTAALAVASLPMQAQSASVQRPSVRPPSSTGLPQQVFVPGFGLRPVLPQPFPVFGWGFDAHHFSVINQHRGLFGGGFIGGGFRGKRFFAGGFFPFVSSSSTVIVVPQPIPVQVPVLVQGAAPVTADPVAEIVVPVGLPSNWSQLRIVRPSYTAEQTPLSQLTLVVLKDHTIFAVTDYWLEDGRIFFVTSTGRQDSVALGDLDWEMTTQLNAERHVAFVLRSR